MQFGYFTMPLHPPGSNVTETLREDLDQIIILDQLGYTEAWIGEHFTFEWENIPNPDLFIAQAAAYTKRIKFGTGVSCMPNHNPVMLAHRIAQLDHQLQGRLMWGIGSSSTPGDYQLFGFDPEKDGANRRDFSIESVKAILDIWNDPKPGEYTNGYWKYTIPEPVEEIGLRVHLKPYQKPHPPIAVGGISPNSPTLEKAGRNGWIPLSINLVPTQSLKSHWDAYAKGAKVENLNPDRTKWRIAREVYVAETDEKARTEALEGTMGRDFEEYWLKLAPWTVGLDRFKLDIDMPDSDLTLEYLMEHVWIVGSPETVTQKIKNLYNDTGGFGTLLVMGHEWNPRNQWINSMTLLTEEVLPNLNKSLISN